MNEEFLHLAERVRELEALTHTHLVLNKQHKPPVRQVDGMLVYADGVDWNPGSGAGLYQYRGFTWVFIG